MNWERGFSRAWLVLSAIWVAMIGAIGAIDPYIRANAVWAAVVPPSALFAAGCAIRWIAQGFRR